VAVVPLDPNAPSREEVAQKNQVVASADNPLDQVVSNRQVVVHTLVVVGLLDSLAAPSQEEAVYQEDSQEDHLDAAPAYAHRDLLCQEHRKVAAA
jgi:cephalosporin-C deacetylase-like acetyl esterase